MTRIRVLGCAAAAVLVLLPFGGVGPAAAVRAAGPPPAASGATYLCGPDYGYTCLGSTGYSGQSVWGSWGPGHNCVSYAAYRLQQNGSPKPWNGQIGNANQWDDKARAAGYSVDGNPVVGSIAEWETGGGGAGHIAYVEAVTSSTIDVSEDSYLTDTSGYESIRRITTGSASWPNNFLHIKDPTSGPLPDGSFVSTPDGKAWQIVGGAPIYIDNWAPYGGPQSTTHLTDFSGYQQYPRDGSALDAHSSGQGWEVVGGAPVIVDNWSTIGNPRTFIVNDGALDASTQHSYGHLLQYPRDGTALDARPSGQGWVVVGGAPLIVDDWSAIGNPQSTPVNDGALDATYQFSHGHLLQYPRDGTALDARPSGQGWEVVGGAPVIVDNWSTIGNPQTTAASTTVRWTRRISSPTDTCCNTRVTGPHSTRDPQDRATKLSVGLRYRYRTGPTSDSRNQRPSTTVRWTRRISSPTDTCCNTRVTGPQYGMGGRRRTAQDSRSLGVHR